MKSLFQIAPIRLFNVLIIYVFSSYAWWTYLLWNKHTENFNEKVELMEAQSIHSGNTAESFHHSASYVRLQKKLDLQHWMVLGESSVFLCLLTLGAWRLNRSMRKEINLSRMQQNFLLSITHELRSPIASARLSAETLLKHENISPEKHRLLLGNSVKDLERLQALVENLLIAARMDNHTYRMNLQEVNFSEVVHELYEAYSTTYQSQRQFNAMIADHIVIQSDRMALTAMVGNLIDNAVKYSKEGDSIQVKLNTNEDYVFLEVNDTGAGIAQEERKNIFKKFYRIGREETRRAKGTGLGLYIVAKILELHHGSVTVENNTPRGSVFKIELPLSKS